MIQSGQIRHDKYLYISITHTHQLPTEICLHTHIPAPPLRVGCLPPTLRCLVPSHYDGASSSGVGKGYMEEPAVVMALRAACSGL